jgi:biopolymer transport protein ExbD
MQLVDGSGLDHEINVTPLIDVLLVLLVTFMVIIALEAKLMLNVPPQERSPARTPQPSIVLDLSADGGYAINGTPVRRVGLEARLRAFYERRPVKILLIHTAGTRPYRDVIDAMDVARAAGIDVIGYMP